MKLNLATLRLDLLKLDRSRRGSGVACYIKRYLAYNYKDNFCKSTECVVVDIFLPKEKPILVGILYRPPDKNDFVKNLERTFAACDILENQECYLLGDFNINLLHNGKNIFGKKGYTSKLKSLPSLTKGYLDFGCSYFLEQLISFPARITESTGTLIDHVLTNSTHKIIQSDVIEMSLSDHELIYSTRKTTKLKCNKHNELNIRTMKNYIAESFIELLNKIDFWNYQTFSYVNKAYLDFITKLITAIDTLCLSKKIRIKGNIKAWFDSELISLINKRDDYYKKFKSLGLDTDKDLLKAAKISLKNIIQKKKRTFFPDKLKENSNNSKELWKAVKSLGMNSKNVNQSKICLKENGIPQFKPKRNANFFKTFYSDLAANFLKKLVLKNQ